MVTEKPQAKKRFFSGNFEFVLYIHYDIVYNNLRHGIYSYEEVNQVCFHLKIVKK